MLKVVEAEEEQRVIARLLPKRECVEFPAGRPTREGFLEEAISLRKV